MSTTLTAGDIAIIGFNFDNPDEFAFVLLADLTSGTEINFTDKGWQSSGSLRSGEGIYTWTASSNLVAGTIISLSDTDIGGSNVVLGSGGDQILAYQDNGGTLTFIYALNSDGIDWQPDASTASTSALPAGLTNGDTAIALDEIDNAVYTGITSGTKAELLAAISNQANWTGSNANNERQTLPTTAFTVGAGTPDTTAPTATTFTPGDDATNVAVADNLSVTFSEDIKQGTGNILLKDAGGTTIETFDVATAANLTVSGSTLTIDPSSDLVSSTGYYLEIANGAILDLSDNAYTGLSGATAWNFTTADVAPPEIASLTPTDDANNVGIGDVLSIQFDENIQKGTGNLVIKKVSDNSDFETIDITSFSVGVNNNTLIIDPASDLDSGTAYYVEIDAGAVQDTAGNNFAGITGNATWNFNTAAPGAGDTTAPVTTTFTPADDAININVAENLGILFNEDIQKGTGNIVLKDEQGAVVETFDVATSIQLQIVLGKGLVIDPTSDLNPATTYYVEIDATAITDVAGNAYAGLAGTEAWNFRTTDTVAPVATAFTPADDATNAAVAANLSVTFDEDIRKGAGNIVIKKASDDSVVETISVANAAVTVSGNTLTVNPGSNLELATDYYVEIDTGAIEDISGNDFLGIADNTTWNFTTTATVTNPGGGSTGGGSTGGGSTGGGSTGGGSTGGGSTSGGPTGGGSTDNPATDNIDSGSASGGSTDNNSNSGVNLGSRPSNNSGTPIAVSNVVSNTEHTLPEPNLTVDTLLGGDTDDFLPGTADANDLSGFGGQDTLVGFAANDNLAGNDGDDLMFGNQGTDYMDGGNGRDTMFGGQGEDALQGGDNADILIGDIGQDCLHGNDGNDVIFGNTGNDSISGGLGDDIVFAGQDDDFVEGNENNDILLGDVGNDNLNGDSGNDILFGNLGNDRLDGGDGDDWMFGGQDNDTLIGNMGGDILSGDLGDDSLIGGAGGDRFDFRSGDGNDIIADFTDGQDIIGLADGLTFEQLAISQVGNDTQITATGLSITLQGVSFNTIDSTDFALV